MTSAYDSDLAGILENQEKYSVSLLQATRILYWVHLNNDYRENARELAKQGQLPHSTFNPSQTQMDNMRTLLALLEFADRGAREITIAELYRELGQFDRAIDILQKIDSPSLKSETILEAARKGISAPIPILYTYQQKK
jgi:tetratricopeptide (TPR) repeat protein